jgi:hypothetical protein
MFGLRQKQIADCEEPIPRRSFRSLHPLWLSFPTWLFSINLVPPTNRGRLWSILLPRFRGFGRRPCLSVIGGPEHPSAASIKCYIFEGDSAVKPEVIARYLSSQAQAEALPLSQRYLPPPIISFTTPVRPARWQASLRLPNQPKEEAHRPYSRFAVD